MPRRVRNTPGTPMPWMPFCRHCRTRAGARCWSLCEEVLAPRRLLLTMCPGQQDETVIEAQLAAVGDQTTLVIEERSLPLGEVADHGAGWQAHAEDLAAHVAGGEPADWRSRRPAPAQ